MTSYYSTLSLMSQTGLSRIQRVVGAVVADMSSLSQLTGSVMSARKAGLSKKCESLSAWVGGAVGSRCPSVQAVSSFVEDSSGDANGVDGSVDGAVWSSSKSSDRQSEGSVAATGRDSSVGVRSGSAQSGGISALADSCSPPQLKADGLWTTYRESINAMTWEKSS
jgi:hypothetical protein